MKKEKSLGVYKRGFFKKMSQSSGSKNYDAGFYIEFNLMQINNERVGERAARDDDSVTSID